MTRDLVAYSDRHVSFKFVQVNMQICAANPCRIYFDDNLAWARGWHRYVPDFNIADSSGELPYG
jgi:hypothetical protein